MRFEAHVRRTEGHVLLDSGHEKLVVGVLENQPHRLPHQRQGPARERNPAHHHFALRRHQQPVGMQQQGRFSGPVGSHESHLLSVRNAERHAPERLVTVGVTIMHVVEQQVVVAHRIRVERVSTGWNRRSSRSAEHHAARNTVSRIFHAGDSKTSAGIRPVNPRASMARLISSARSKVRISSCPTSVPQTFSG